MEQTVPSPPVRARLHGAGELRHTANSPPTGDYRRITRWEHEAVLEAMQQRLDRQPEMMRVRRQTVEHPFGTIKYWMGRTHFLTKTLARVRTEMSLQSLPII
jgi:Transposase DDE domain